MMVTVLSLLGFLISFIVIFGLVISGPKYHGPVSDHFDGKKFINPGDVKAKGFPDVFKWMFTRKRGPWQEIKSPNYGNKPVARVNTGMRITFVNHSTFLIQTDGINILTDPVWSKRTSPFEWAGPRRMRPPGLKFEDLPPIDVLLLSHNHWDHLDIRTVRKIFNAHQPKIITPLGVGKFLNESDVPGAIDMDWWQEQEPVSGLRVQCVPAQHFSGRGMFDRDATLWCGYVIKRTGGNIYFAGDTGYNPNTFKEIGSRCAPISLAMIPIGAFKPQWFMSPIHCSPSEAVKIHLEVRAKSSVATHFGTFALADDGQMEPIDDLKSAIRSAGLNSDSFIVLNEGIARDF
jgi:L-ascorbate metabolism protein UlaG (beta-lactamase superfamily)